jgi:hypothetical protein
MALHGEHARRVVELLADVFADALQRAAAGATVDSGSWRTSTRGRLRQRCALGLLALGCVCVFGAVLERGSSSSDRLEVGLEGLIEQVALLAVQLFAAARRTSNASGSPSRA